MSNELSLKFELNSKKNLAIIFSILISSGLFIRLIFADFNLPIFVDATDYYVYSYKVVTEYNIPKNVLENNDGWSWFLSFFFMFFRETDFAITSNGRTVFELAAMNVPIITIHVNNREKTHSFVKYADVGFQIDPDLQNFETTFLDCFNKMCSHKIRKKYKTQLKNLDLLEGINLVYNIINNKYDEFKKERNI